MCVYVCSIKMRGRLGCEVGDRILYLIFKHGNVKREFTHSLSVGIKC